ncbi:hypothetical protein [Streptomyces sp. NPDC057579]|uniref:hypothetical protein n=1 Tax=Streptomyces sp. NPDC057579 TaxID=3346172 RepID=UPI00368BB70B
MAPPTALDRIGTPEALAFGRLGVLPFEVGGGVGCGFVAAFTAAHSAGTEVRASYVITATAPAAGMGTAVGCFRRPSSARNRASAKAVGRPCSPSDAGGAAFVGTASSASSPTRWAPPGSSSPSPGRTSPRRC